MEKKVMAKVLILATVAIAPHLIAVDTKTLQVMQIEKLSMKEREEIEELTEKAVVRIHEESPNNL